MSGGMRGNGRPQRRRRELVRLLSPGYKGRRFDLWGRQLCDKWGTQGGNYSGLFPPAAAEVETV